MERASADMTMVGWNVADRVYGCQVMTQVGFYFEYSRADIALVSSQVTYVVYGRHVQL